MTNETTMTADEALAAVFSRFGIADVRIGRDHQWLVTITTASIGGVASAWGDDLASTIVEAANSIVSKLSIAQRPTNWWYATGGNQRAAGGNQ